MTASTPSPARVLFCQPTAQRTGSEMSLVEILRGLDRRLVEPHVLLGEAGPMEEELRGLAQELIVVRSRKLARSPRAALGFVASFPRVAASIRRLRRERGIEAVHVNTLMFPQALIGARLASLPALTHVREVRTTYPAGVFASYSALATALSTRIVCPCEFVRSQPVPLRSTFDRKARVVYNSSSFPAPEAERRLSRPVNLLAVIPTTEKKGVFDLVAGLHALLRLAPDLDFRLRVVGRIFRPDPFTRLSERVAELGLTERLTFCGEQEDLAPFYREAHVLIHPSHTEAFPRVLVEALNFGLPCVATDAGGSREAVEDGVTGYVVPIRDPQRLAAAVSEVVADDEGYAALSRNALRRHAESFTSTVMAGRISSLVLETLGRGVA